MGEEVIEDDGTVSVDEHGHVVEVKRIMLNGALVGNQTTTVYPSGAAATLTVTSKLARTRAEDEGRKGGEP